MGRAGIEPATLGLRVRPNELQRAACNGISLQRRLSGYPANGNELQPTEPIPYAHSYAPALDLHNRARRAARLLSRCRPRPLEHRLLER